MKIVELAVLKTEIFLLFIWEDLCRQQYWNHPLLLSLMNFKPSIGAMVFSEAEKKSRSETFILPHKYL